jgi:hypothetical protein
MLFSPAAVPTPEAAPMLLQSNGFAVQLTDATLVLVVMKGPPFVLWLLGDQWGYRCSGRRGDEHFGKLSWPA